MIKGDHLISPRTGYEHHGLFIGNEKVIHYSGFSESFTKGSIQITSLEEFEQGEGSTVKSHLASFYDADERVARAFSKLGEDSYNLIFNNCEHFVNWCFNGFKNSSQVNNATTIAATLAQEYLKRKSTQTTASVVAQQMARTTATKTIETAIASMVVRSAVSTTASTAVGVTAATATTGATVTGLVSTLAVGSIASVAAPIVVTLGVGYSVKKVFDWILD